ncbi:hypothetical protein D9M68_448170 [compost metagenome]
MNSGTSARSMKPWRAVTTQMPAISCSASMRRRASTRGVSHESTRSTITCSCSTWLCLRLCSSACGTAVASGFRNTAVPLTRCGMFSASDSTKGRSGRLSAAAASRPRRRPLAQVVNSTITPAATASVSQPPSATFRLLDTTKVRSTAAKAATPTTTATLFQRHRPQATMPANNVVVTIVIDTAMPYAADSAPELRKPSTSSSTPTISSQLTAGT